MAIKEYPIWQNKKLEIPWYAGSTSDTVKKDIAWDEAKTKIRSGRLDITAKANARTNLDIYLNYNEVIHFHWELWEEGARKEASEDITALIKNGTNIFSAEFYKDPVNPLGVGVIFTVTVLIEFEGEEPTVEPWWKKYALPIAIASGVAGGTLAIVSTVRRK